MTFRTILLAADMEPHSAYTIDYAFAFAEKYGATVHILHASPNAQPHEHEAIGEKLANVLARHSGSASLGRSFIGTEEPVAAVIRAASELSVDLIIMGTRDRQGMNRVMLGSTAEGVLKDSRTPVLIVKADAHV